MLLEEEDAMGVITLDLNPPMLPTSVPDLREAVGWDRMDGIILRHSRGIGQPWHLAHPLPPALPAAPS